MACDPRYEILFEEVRIGPVTAKNRFFQVPHCTGAGHQYINTQNRIREIRAEGGWAVVCTDLCSIHPTADASPYAYLKLWDDRDEAALAAMAESVHKHGALAGCQLMHEGVSAVNRMTREVPIGPSPRPHRSDPKQTRAMSKDDIRDVLRWQRRAALRAKRAGFDIVYVYASHGLSLVTDFLSRNINQRNDEYGGSLKNRARLLREMIEVTKDAVGDTCAVAVRLAVDDFGGENGLTSSGEGRDVVEMLADLPDLWDVNVADFTNDSPTARFCGEGHQEPYIDFVKKVTSKPVVGVGWFTSPDTMVSQIKRGVLDLIGAARPGIADPFIPEKVRNGNHDDIRECIGCNICLAGEYTVAPMRCTQNPTMGEEWRRGWHPEYIEPKGSDSSILVVGGGPAGLEAARALGQRGYSVTLAEASRELGGRINAECRLPGMSSYARVRDWRVGQLQRMSNVECYLESELTPDDVMQFGADHIVVATGARWSATGISRHNHFPIPKDNSVEVITPDDVFAGWRGTGPVLIYDDEGYYMAAAIALHLRVQGVEVAIVTPQGRVAHWMANTAEINSMNKALIENGAGSVTNRNLTELRDGRALLTCVFSGRQMYYPVSTVIMVTMRESRSDLFDALVLAKQSGGEFKAKSIRKIGDCLAPSIVAEAVHSGHLYARQLDSPLAGGIAFGVEHTTLGPPLLIG